MPLFLIFKFDIHSICTSKKVLCPLVENINKPNSFTVTIKINQKKKANLIVHKNNGI